MCAINFVISDLAYNVAWGAFYLIKRNITLTCPHHNNFSLCATVTRANVGPIFVGRFTDYNNKKRFQLILSEEIPSLNLIVLITVRIQNNYVSDFRKLRKWSGCLTNKLRAGWHKTISCSNSFILPAIILSNCIKKLSNPLSLCCVTQMYWYALHPEVYST